MSDELVIASSTDEQSVVTASAQNDAEGARVPEVPMESEELDGSTAISYEHPRSERTMLIERLVAAHEAKFAERAEPEASERIASSELLDESGDGLPDGDDIESQAGAPEWTRPDHPYFQKLQETYAWYGPEKIREIVEPVIQAGVNVVDGVAAAISELPNGPQVLLNLCRDPWCPDGLVALSEMTPKQARRVLGEWSRAVEQLEESGRETQQPVARRSSAPPPIKPVGGSSTNSSVSMSDPDMPYRDWCRAREAQIRANRRR